MQKYNTSVVCLFRDKTLSLCIKITIWYTCFHLEDVFKGVCSSAICLSNISRQMLDNFYLKCELIFTRCVLDVCCFIDKVLFNRHLGDVQILYWFCFDFASCPIIPYHIEIKTVSLSLFCMVMTSSFLSCWACTALFSLPQSDHNR